MTSLPAFTTANVLVYGDLMLDRYWYGQTSRISPEAPVPVVHVQNDEYRAGGGANVALNVAALGAQVNLFGLVGQDQQADILETVVKQARIAPYFLRLADYPTITKLRVVGQNQQLLRMDFEKGFVKVNDSELQTQFVQQLSQA